MTTTVELPPEIERRLDALVARTGRNRSAYLREIIEMGLEDAEDLQSATETLDRISRGEEEVLSSKDFWRGLDA